MDSNLTLISVFVGMLISIGIEQSPYFQDATKPGLSKVLIVFAFCIVWAFGMEILALNALPSGYLAWRDLIEQAVVAAIGSQLLHQSVNNWLPSFGAFLVALRTPSKITATTTQTATGDTQTTKVEVAANASMIGGATDAGGANKVG